MHSGKKKREREERDSQDALIRQLWEQGKDDKFIAEKVFQHASFEAFVLKRRWQMGGLHTKEGSRAS